VGHARPPGFRLVIHSPPGAAEGTLLLTTAGVRVLHVATAAASSANLRFYQRRGFRMRSVERDAFTAATGYPPGITVEGIPLRDRVWLDMEL
jgi:hypothetical protein